MRAARETPADEADPARSGLLQLRVGLHCGPVSGNVVGSQARPINDDDDDDNIFNLKFFPNRA